MRLLHRLNIRNSVAIRDSVKSWDVLKAVQCTKNNVLRDGCILDIGGILRPLVTVHLNSEL